MTTTLALSILAGLATTGLLTKLWQTRVRTASRRSRIAWSLAGWGVLVVLGVAVWVVAQSKLVG